MVLKFKGVLFFTIACTIAIACFLIWIFLKGEAIEFQGLLLGIVGSIIASIVYSFMNSFINNKNGINDKIDELQKDLNVLKEYNFDEYNKFISLFNDIKHLIRVRISKLNRTGATDEFSLKEPDISGLNEFNSLLLQKGFDSYVFYSCKNDNLNCGQLIYTMGTRNNIIPEKELSCLI